MALSIHVALDGAGDYQSLSEALRTIPLANKEPVTIYLHEGIYKEKLEINRPYIITAIY